MMQLGPSKIPFNLKLFDAIAVPPAESGHNIVFVTCVNAEDGVGDLANMKDLGQAIKKIIAGKGYILYGIAFIGSVGKKYISDRRSEFENIFDTFKEINRPPYEMGALSAGEKAILHSFLFSISKEISQAACEIMVPMIEQTFLGYYLPTGIHSIQIGEYGNGNLFVQDLSMSRASMGFLNTDEKRVRHWSYNQENWSFGIKLNREKLRPYRENPEILLDINEPHFVKLLIGCQQQDVLSLEIAKNYLNTHEFMIAYPQSAFHAYFFVMTQLYRNLDQHGKLIRSCDFFLPKISVVREQLKGLFEKFNILNFAFFTDGDAEVIGTGKSEVRIFSNIIRKDSDYENLYFLQPIVAGASGNSTLSTCIESYNIPLILWHGGMDLLFPKMWLKFIEDNHHDGKNSLLYQYFELGTHLHGLWIGDEKHSILAQQLANLLKNEQLRNDWLKLREDMIQNHNFYDSLPGIVKGGLSISRSQAMGKEADDFKQALLQCDALQRLIAENLISRETLLTLPYAKIKYLAEPLINYLLLEKCITVNEALDLDQPKLVLFYDFMNFYIEKKIDLIQSGIISTKVLLTLSECKIRAIFSQVFYYKILNRTLDIRSVLSLDDSILSTICDPHNLPVMKVVNFTNENIAKLSDPKTHQLLHEGKIGILSALKLEAESNHAEEESFLQKFKKLKF